MIFHDDDILLPGYLDHAIYTLESDPSFSAVACNSFLYENEKLGTTTMRDVSMGVVVHSHSLLFKSYTDPWGCGAPPLSTFIYRASVIVQHRFVITQAGKYSDILFLAAILGAGPFLWLSCPYACYRIHPGSDNSQFVFSQKLGLLRLIHVLYGFPKHDYMLLSARAIYYRQSFGISPSVQSLLRFNSRARRDVVQRFITKMMFLRVLRSPAFRKEKLVKVAKLISAHLRL
jgi:hypothetical protein